MIDDVEADKQIALMSALLKLDIPPEWRNDIIAHLKDNAAMAALVLEQPFADDIEVAPVFAA